MSEGSLGEKSVEGGGGKGHTWSRCGAGVACVRSRLEHTRLPVIGVSEGGGGERGMWRRCGAGVACVRSGLGHT